MAKREVKPQQPTTRARVTTYLVPKVYEAFATDALTNGRSVSGHVVAILTKYLQRAGYEIPAPEGTRATRRDFDPGLGLAKALRAKAAAQERDAEKLRARIAKLEQTR